jgi:DNA polymerase I-like protein with 3'-5' exonuclease and polymerase domains
MPLLKPRTNIRYLQTLPEMREAIQEITQLLSYQENPRIALDVETYWSSGEEWDEEEKRVPRPIKNNGGYEGLIRTVQIGLPPEVDDVQYVFDVKKIEQTAQDRQEVSDLLRPLLTTCKIYGQNLQYEFMFMWAIYKIRIPKKNLRDVRHIRAVIAAGDKTARSNLGALYDDYLPAQFFKEYTGMFQGEYKDFKKEMQKSKWGAEELSQEQIQYAADDVSRLIFELYDWMLEKHPVLSVDAFIEKYETRNKPGQTVLNIIKQEWMLIPIFAMMELRGMEYDIDYHMSVVIPFLEKTLAEKQEIVNKHISREVVVKRNNGKRGKARETWETIERQPINIGSWRQLLKGLESIGISVPNTQEETLIIANDETPHEALEAILEYKKLNTIYNKYGRVMPKHIRTTGRIHPSWLQLGGDQAIATGRTAAKEPPVLTLPDSDDVSGTAARDLCRKPVKCRKGYKLGNADYSQAEPRIQAGLCNDEALQEVYSEGSDIDQHSLTAKVAFNLDYYPDNTDPYRKAGKTYNLGSGYGMGVEKGRHKIKVVTKGAIDLSKDEYKELQERLNGKFQGVKRMKDKIASELRRTLGVSLVKGLGGAPLVVRFTPKGRPRLWYLQGLVKKEVIEEARKNPIILHKDYETEETPKWRNAYNSVFSKISRDAFNFECGQGVGADMFKDALLLVQDALDENGFDFETEGIIFEQHDEIMLEYSEEKDELAKQILKDCMLKAAYDMIDGVYFKVSVNSGYDWVEAAHT